MTLGGYNMVVSIFELNSHAPLVTRARTSLFIPIYLQSSYLHHTSIPNTFIPPALILSHILPHLHISYLHTYIPHPFLLPVPLFPAPNPPSWPTPATSKCRNLYIRPPISQARNS